MSGTRRNVDHSHALTTIERTLRDLRRALGAAETTWEPHISRVHPGNHASALNLAHYWAIRQHDLRDVQPRLTALGLSSLGRSEPNVRANLDAVAAAAGALARRRPPGDDAEADEDLTDGRRILRRRARELLGPAPKGRHSRIMVTLPTAAADDDALVRALIEHGMDVARINCAHDGPHEWARMIAHVRRAAADAGRPCRVAMDLPGPKLRTGPLLPGPSVVRVRPVRDALGRVLEAAPCWLTAQDAPVPPPRPDAVVVPVPADWLAGLRTADSVTLRDTRGARRVLVVGEVLPGGVLARVDRTVYLASGTVLHAPNGDAPVGALPPVASSLLLRPGDRLTLTADCAPVPAGPDEPARIGCTLPEVFGHIAPGQRVHLDDGKISGIVGEVRPGRAEIRVTRAAANGSRLRAGKGINLPDTRLPVPALTEDDRQALRFVARNADIVQMSFVRSARDVEDLLRALDDLGGDRLGVVVKIETVQGFENLPEILLAVMRRPHAGVMIARGDLAVECGYERLAEVQEEILWLCEAARLPVVWATQVLDRLARRGLPSRAEITDAAMGVRAECVMLNKGPHIVEAVDILGGILARMSGHQHKKTPLLRPLRSWRRLPSAVTRPAGREAVPS